MKESKERAKGKDKLVNLVAKWQFEQRESDKLHHADKFDFLNNPASLNQMRE